MYWAHTLYAKIHVHAHSHSMFRVFAAEKRKKNMDWRPRKRLTSKVSYQYVHAPQRSLVRVFVAEKHK